MSVVPTPVEPGTQASRSGEPPAPSSNVIRLPSRAPSAEPWWSAAKPRRPWVWLVLLVLASGWDRAIWLHVSRRTLEVADRLESWGFSRVFDLLTSWRIADALDALRYVAYHTVKLFGTVWAPALLAAVLVLRPFFQSDTGRVRRGLRRGTLVFLCPAAAGLIAELLKLVFKRQRPEFADGHYAFRWADWLADPLNGSGLGLPSSHAAVAVGSAIALAAVFPRQRAGWWLLAGACCLSRVLAGAHFASDVVLGAMVALATGRAILALDLRNNRGVPVPA